MNETAAPLSIFQLNSSLNKHSLGAAIQVPFQGTGYYPTTDGIFKVIVGSGVNKYANLIIDAEVMITLINPTDSSIIGSIPVKKGMRLQCTGNGNGSGYFYSYQ